MGKLCGALAFVAAGCGTSSAGKQAALRPASVWAPHLHERPAGAVDPSRYRGTLFTVHARDASFTGAAWIRCPLQVSYRFESIEPRTEIVDIADTQTLARFFPVHDQDLLDLVVAGHALRVTYVVSGRFVLDVPSPRAASIVCPAATHHVRSVLVGAYRMETWGSEDVAGGAGVISADVRADTRGRPAACGQIRSALPVSGCTVPLAFELSPVPGHDPDRKMRADELARPENVPTESSMPGALRRSEQPPVTAGFRDCHAGFQLTGDAARDLATLTDRCGAPTGMVAHSEVLTGWQADTADVARYTVPVESGSCYRAFGVGGEGIRDLDMGLHDPTGRLVARDVRPEPWAILSPEEPVCVRDSGSYELVVSVEAGQGDFAVQVWRLER